MGVRSLREVDMKPMSTAQTMSSTRSGSQKVRGRIPRTPRKTTCFDSSAVATAASLRMARQMCPMVAAKVRDGWRTMWTRSSSLSFEMLRRKSLIGWKAAPE